MIVGRHPRQCRGDERHVCCGIKNSDSQAVTTPPSTGGADVDERRRTLGAAVLIGARPLHPYRPLDRFRQQRRVRRRTLMPVAAVAAGAFDAMGLDPTFSPPTRRLARLPVAHAHGFRALLLAPFQKALRLALNALRPDFACKAVDR